MTGQRTIAVVTGSRAEFGLLIPIIRAIEAHDNLTLHLIVTGVHFDGHEPTIHEVEQRFEIPPGNRIELDDDQLPGRFADAARTGSAMRAFTQWLTAHQPDVVLILGDRIEAFAAAAAAAVSGIRVAHVHGGDRAEGIADESLRHAITKLAHIHFPASARSAERIIAMGEEPLRVHLVGSPAIDALADIPKLDDETFTSLGSPEIVFLLHPTALGEDVEYEHAARLLLMCREFGRVLALHPNHDPDRAGILRAIDEAHEVPNRAHLPREMFLGLLRRVKMIVGNSSAGLIECAVVPVRCVNVGPRQAGREKPQHVINCPRWDFDAIEAGLCRASVEPLVPFRHPYGDGRAGERIANLLATFDSDNHALRKLNSY